MFTTLFPAEVCYFYCWNWQSINSNEILVYLDILLCWPWESHPTMTHVTRKNVTCHMSNVTMSHVTRNNVTCHLSHVTWASCRPVCTATATFCKKYDTGEAWRRLMYGGRTRITRKMVALCFINDNVRIVHQNTRCHSLSTTDLTIEW